MQQIVENLLHPGTVPAKTCRPGALRLRDERGFTLIELLVVLVILGLLAGLVGPRVIGYLGGARSDTARLQIQQLAASIDLFALDVGRYPSEQEGLAGLVEAPTGAQRWNGPYLANGAVPLDPWGNAYVYRPDKVNRTYKVMSYGADNAAGGEGEDRDVTN